MHIWAAIADDALDLERSPAHTKPPPSSVAGDGCNASDDTHSLFVLRCGGGSLARPPFRKIKTAALAGLLPASVAIALGYPIKAERQLLLS